MPKNGKENSQPKSSQQNELASFEANAIKSLESLLNDQPMDQPVEQHVQQPMVSMPVTLSFGHLLSNNRHAPMVPAPVESAIPTEYDTGLSNSIEYRPPSPTDGNTVNIHGAIGSSRSSSNASPASDSSGSSFANINELQLHNNQLFPTYHDPYNGQASNVAVGNLGEMVVGAAAPRGRTDECNHCAAYISSFYCVNCKILFCVHCMAGHTNHKIHKFNRGEPESSELNHVPRLPSLENKCGDTETRCTRHSQELRFFCVTCKILVCSECVMCDHPDHPRKEITNYINYPYNIIDNLFRIAEEGKKAIKKSIDVCLKCTKDLDHDVREAVIRHRKTNARILRNCNGLARYEDKEKEFVELMDRFHQCQMSIYNDQSDTLRAALLGVAQVTAELISLEKVLYNMKISNLVETLVNAENKIEHCMTLAVRMTPIKTNVQLFIVSLHQQPQMVPDSQRYMHGTFMMQPDMAVASTSQMNLMPPMMRQGGRPIVRSNRSMQQYNNGAQLVLPTSLNQPSTTSMSVWSMSNGLNMPTHNTNTPIRLRMELPSPEQQMYQNQYPLNLENSRGQCIANYNHPIVVCHNDQPSASFAYDGTMDGQVSRPWGVCVDRDGQVIIGDRRNNRIQVFGPDGIFRFAFGKKGSGDGELELPAGITTDICNRIIVADKDNHRVQVFSSLGRFILKFGTYGREIGEFQYPWDVATNSLGHILVSDTRNHRVQLFTSMGHFLTKYAFDVYIERSMKGHSTPRGIAFTPSGEILITDFENHRLLKLNKNVGAMVLKLAKEGEALNEFNRPSGICVDDKGNIVIADSKNQRILVYDENFIFKWVLDLRKSRKSRNSSSELSNEKDRPSDVAVLPDGRIVVLFETSPDNKDFPDPKKPFVQIF